VPWCETCAKYRAPSAMNPDGTCPNCGNLLDAPVHASQETEDLKAPWHFKLMIVALVVYLVWRFWGLLL